MEKDGPEAVDEVKSSSPVPPLVTDKEGEEFETLPHRL
jgi:hypothetical protein